jgi:HD superfamily phosphodiesterase
MPERLWRRAEGDLCIRVNSGPVDSVVWEHSARVARMAQTISRFADVPSQPLDSDALTAASLYHDLGWILHFHGGRVTREELLLRPTTDSCRDLAADWVVTELKGLLPLTVLQRTATIIRQCADRRSGLAEAQILAEADNLDQIGPPAICLMIRKCRAEGKTLEHLLTAWQRQEEYNYWHARIKESFRFPSVRAIAERRYQALRRFMTDLTASIRLRDLGDPPLRSHPETSDGRPTRLPATES